MTTNAPIAPVRLLSTDLDGTLLGNPEASQRFKAAWIGLSPELRPLLIYNSGRLVDDLRRFVDDGTLPAADYYIGGGGPQAFDLQGGGVLHQLQPPLSRGVGG